MPDIDFDELDRAVHDLMRQSGQLPATQDKPSEAPAATPNKDSTSSSMQAASSQQAASAATSARPEVNDDAQDTSTSSAQDDTSADATQQADSSDNAASAKQSSAPAPQDDADSTDETVQTNDDTATADANSDTDTNSASARHRGVTIMPLSQQADGAELAGEPYEPVESEPVIDRARALSESVVASEREPASMPATPEQTDTDDTDSARVTPLGTATPAVPTTESVSSQPRPAAVVTVDPDDIITPASDDDESDDAYADRAQFFGRSAARPFFAEPRAVTPVDDVLSTTNSDASAPLAEPDSTASSAPGDRAVSDETSAMATEEEMPATIDQVESETPTMPYQFAGEDAESDDDDDEALVRHLNEVNRAQDDETEPAQASVVDDLDDTFAPQPLIIPPPKEEESNTALPPAKTVVEPMDDTHTADDIPAATLQDEPNDITNTSSNDDAGDDHLLYAPETSTNTDVSAVLSSSDTSDTEMVQPLNQSLDEPAWPELQYDDPDGTPDVQTPDGDHTAPAWPEVAIENTSAMDDSQPAAQAADVSVPSEYESFDGESSSWVEPTTVPAQSQAGDIALAELLTAEHTMPDVAADNDSPSPQPEEVLADAEDTMPEARVDRPLPLLSTYNEHRAAPEPHVDALPLSDSQEEANAIDVTDAAQHTNDIAQGTTDMQLPDTPDDQAEQPYAPATPLFAPADDVVAKAQQIIAARPEVSTNDAPTPPQEEEGTPKNAPDVVPITLSQSADQQTKPSVADAPAVHAADETVSAEPNDDQAAAPAIQRPRGRFMDIVGGAAPVAAAAQTARPRVRRQGAVVEPLTSSAPVVGMDIRPVPGHEPAQHHIGATPDTPTGDNAKVSDAATPDGAPSADALDLQPGDEKPLGYTPFLPDAETKVDKRPLGGADTLVGDVPTLADTTPMGMYHDEPGAFGIAPADNNEPSAPPHLFAPHDEHASAEQFIDVLTDTSENAPSLYPTDHYSLPEQDTPEIATPDDEPMYQLEDHYGADRSLYPDEPADSHEASADGAGPQFAEDEIDLSLPVPGPGEPDIDYYGEAERVEAEPMTVETEWDDEPTASDQAHVNTIEEAAATTQNGDTALALHQALQEENEGNVVAPIYSAEEFTRAPKKSRRRPEQAAGWIWLLWIVMLLALGAGLGAVYYTLFT